MTFPPEASGTRQRTEDLSPPRDGTVLPLMLVLGTGLSFRLLAAWAPVPLLVQKTLPDDAFYYFSIARNACDGHGVSVDGLIPTNGFHPLWVLLILPIFGAFRSGDLPVHVSLSLAALFDVGTAYLSYRCVRLLTGDATASTLAAGLLALNPLVAMESQNGLETALSLFCAASAFYVFLCIVRDVGSTSGARWLVFGAVVGLTLLARTDNALLAVCLGLYLLFRRRGQLGATLAGLALSAATAALLLLPWLWWNQHTFGGIVQSSAVAAPAVFRQALWQPLHEGAPWAQVWREGLWPVIHLSLLLAFRYAGVAWTALVVGALLVRLLRRRWLPSQADLRKMGPLLPALVASLLLLAVHTLVRWYPRSWYFMPLGWSSALVAGAVLGNMATALNADRLGRRLLSVGAVGLVLLLGLQGIKDWRQGFYPWQGHMLAGANWVAAETPAGAVVASFNTGLQSYYGQRQVVNLDGVVSWEAVRAIQSHSLFAYAADRGVDFLVDYQAYVLGQYGPYLGVDGGACLLVNRVLSPEYPPYGAVTVYTLDPGCANQAD